MSRCHFGAAWCLGAMLLLGTGSALADSCTDLAPAALRTQLESRFPGFTFPREYDNTPADVARTADRGASPCMGVAKGDFDGDHKEDLVAALTAQDGHGAMMVSVSDAAGAALISVLDQQREGRRTLSLTSAPPGVYARTRAGPDRFDRLSAGEVRALQCPQAAVIIGVSESSARAYCSIDGHWQWVQIAD